MHAPRINVWHQALARARARVVSAEGPLPVLLSPPLCSYSSSSALSGSTAGVCGSGRLRRAAKKGRPTRPLVQRMCSIAQTRTRSLKRSRRPWCASTPARPWALSTSTLRRRKAVLLCTQPMVMAIIRTTLLNPIRSAIVIQFRRHPLTPDLTSFRSLWFRQRPSCHRQRQARLILHGWHPHDRTVIPPSISVSGASRLLTMGLNRQTNSRNTQVSATVHLTCRLVATRVCSRKRPLSFARLALLAS